MGGNERSVESARAYGHVISSLQRGKQFVRFLDWRGEIGIGEKRDTSAGLEHSMAHAVAFAAILPIRDKPQRRKLVRPLLNNLCRPVGRPIIYDDYFGLICPHFAAG